MILPTPFEFKRVYGLTIVSEVPFPELQPCDLAACDLAADVTIRYGELPPSLSYMTGTGVFYEINKHQCLLNLEEVAGARYLIQNGNEIVVEQNESANEADVRVFLLGSAMAVLLFQRDRLPIHASAIQTSRGAVLFSGDSGSGKSTLASALQHRGYATLSDDVSVIDMNSHGKISIHSGIPHVKLWKDAATKLSQPTEAQHRVRDDLEKFRFPHEYEMPTEPMPVRAIYLLQPTNHTKIEIEPLMGMNGISALHRNIYREKLGIQMGLEAFFFNQIARVAQRVPICSIQRPRHTFLLDELVEKLVEQIESEIG